MAKYQIKTSEINKSIRPIGCIIRKMSPYFTDETFRRQNKMLDRWMKGHWLSTKTQVQTVQICRKNGTMLRILVCRSKKVKTRENATGVLWIHGGGYAIGVPEQDFLFADMFCKDGTSVAVLPDYTRSTSSPYPAALEDCYLTLCWMRENADKLGINRRQIFVGGDSAGGGLTAALCQYARDMGKVSIAFQMPLYPMLDDREMTASSQNNDAPLWNTKSNRAGWKLYLNGLETIPAYAAPSRCEDYTGLPPICTYVGTIEPFHDETIRYCEAVKAAGIPVHLKEFEGCFHAFDLVAFPTKPAKEARRFLAETYRYAQQHYFTEEDK